MADQILCPQCGSENVFFSRKRAVHECEDCHLTFTVEKPFEGQRIFLSYGHDSAESAHKSGLRYNAFIQRIVDEAMARKP